MARELKILREVEIKPILNELKILKEENQLLKQQVLELSGKIDLLEQNSTSDSPFSITENIIREISDREKRANNFIIYGSQENPNSNNDSELVKLLLTDLGVEVSINNVTRIGSIGKNNRPRPIKVQTSSANIIGTIFRNISKLKSLPQWSGISLSRDQTLMQRNQFLAVKQEMNSRLENGETNLKIKYKNRYPIIVSTEN